MRINDTIVRAYLNGEDISKYRNEWYFTHSSIASDINKNIFTTPEYDDEMRKKVQEIRDAVFALAERFVPTNAVIWDTLFPQWQTDLNDYVQIDIIVGFPRPYDATVQTDDIGKKHAIFDAVCWSDYIGHCDLALTVQNLLTHELAHLMIGKNIPHIDDDTESDDYITHLDAITFHEAFAHLLAYNAQEITDVDWNSKMLCDVRKRSVDKMRDALAETSPARQIEFLDSGLCGKYYDKFACMAGMLYLAEQWQAGGNDKLLQCYNAGYHGFAMKTSE